MELFQPFTRFGKFLLRKGNFFLKCFNYRIAIIRLKIDIHKERIHLSRLYRRLAHEERLAKAELVIMPNRSA